MKLKKPKKVQRNHTHDSDSVCTTKHVEYGPNVQHIASA